MSHPTASIVSLMLMLAAAAAAGCGSRGELEQRRDGVPAHHALPGLTGRSCDYLAAAPTDGFSRLARPGTRGNISLWGVDATPADSVVLSVRYDEEGRLAWVRAIGSSLLPGPVEDLERLLLESVYERGPADWGFRVRVVGGDFGGIQPSVVCPAERRRDGGGLPVFLPNTQRALWALEQMRGRTIPVRIWVDEGGRILDVRMSRLSGNNSVNQFILDWIHGMQFHPQLHDGIPMTGMIELRVYIPRRR